jgi:glycerol-3-phosphate O-acyltransferase / dihydroxyacetone phosphate acyltransferase
MEFYPFYYLMKLPFYCSVHSYYRKLQFKNTKILREKRPVLIAMNHPNSFMDPISFASHVKPKLFFLARGDSFKKGIAPLLEGVGIIPIFRLRDSGREGMQKNDETFRIVKSHLKRNHNVIIFAEGLCIQERRLRNLKKGCARMAFGAYEEMRNPDLVVIPVGVNYQNDPSKFRHRELFIVGDPIKVSDYFPEYEANNAKGVNRLTEVIQAGMKKTVVHINQAENDKLVEQIEEITLDQFLEEAQKDPEDLEERHQLTLKIVEGVNTLTKEQAGIIVSLREKLSRYFSFLEKNKIRDKLLRTKFANLSTLPSLLARTILFIGGIPIWIAALITNYPPYALCILGGKKLTKDIEWYASVTMLIGTFMFPLYYFAQYFTIWKLFHDWRIFLAYLPVPFILGWFALHYSPFRKKLFGSWRYYSLKKNPGELNKFIELRKELITEIKTLLK